MVNLWMHSADQATQCHTVELVNAEPERMQKELITAYE
jgi:hypothetical protein